MSQQKSYTILLSKRSRIHVRFSRKKTKVLDFAVNFEILYPKKWHPVIRYDTAHQGSEKQRWKFPHKHTFYRDGKETLVFLRTKDKNLALTLAIQDIRENFKRIKGKFFN